ncbi:MAG: hypothetical protein COY75_11160 [Nitrospirae bacterium CG_4_10_14_0_8_um_filter_41_23]|nr:MAG: hypothetical protein COS27_06910 [Nitrospirae bacterium CG02_land_8_20_14_3_00_41_53]PIY85857.1 MAG: hypothetical protein COY75_11160 [Nitrospirae bacterium CG_4_10_14_0_8_um_filter_41_23]
MRRHWNNKGKIIFRSGLFALSSLLFALCLILPDRANSGPYTTSAHGSSYGVNRTGLSSFGYSVGNCAHCHEQHASIGGQTITPARRELFYEFISKCDHICYKCHNNTGAEMQVLNYPYCVSFGGYTLTWPGIYKHFCGDTFVYTVCGSRHHQGQIRDTLKDNAHGWGYPNWLYGCSGCHNVHMSQRIGATQYHQPYDPSKSPITRPSEHYNNPLNLWGDDAGERMDQYASSVGGHYLAPYYGSFGGSQYEPAGQAAPTDGSNLPDYVTFCMDCHQYAQSDPETGASVKAIDWDTNGDKHGGRPSGDCPCGGTWEQGNLRAPYSDANKEAGYNYVLSCTDCHEPHGSPNRLHLIRRFVNGENVAAGTDTVSPCDDSDADWQQICGRCHTSMHTSFGGCPTCHRHGYDADWCSPCVSDRTF